MSRSQDIHPTAAIVYRWIVMFKRAHAGDSPSRREIAAGVGLASVAVVQHHLVRLEEAGLITRPARGEARRIGIPGAVWRVEEERRVEDTSQFGAFEHHGAEQ